MMKFDNRCIQLTIRRTTAVPQMVTIQHGPDCSCEPYPNKSVTIKFDGTFKEYCPCGAKQHKGMCRDALLAAQGREAPSWKQ